MKIILYQPEIAQNLGAIMRLCACFDICLEIIEPCGFPLTSKALRRTAMDYGKPAALIRHTSWANFSAQNTNRLIALTTKASVHLQDFSFQSGDALIFGQESAGLPENVHTHVDARVKIPLSRSARSLNLATSASISLFEALRQTGGLPPPISALD